MGGFHTEIGSSKSFRETMLKAMLPHIVLKQLASKPIHGYGLIEKLRKEQGVYLGPSTVYPLLEELQQKELITSAWMFNENRHPKKVYDITQKGRLLLRETSATLALVNREETITM